MKWWLTLGSHFQLLGRSRCLISAGNQGCWVCFSWGLKVVCLHATHCCCKWSAFSCFTVRASYCLWHGFHLTLLLLRFNPDWKLSLNLRALYMAISRVEYLTIKSLRFVLQQSDHCCRPAEVLITFDLCCHLAMRMRRNLPCAEAGFGSWCINSSSAWQRLMTCMCCLHWGLCLGMRLWVGDLKSLEQGLECEFP